MFRGALFVILSLFLMVIDLIIDQENVSRQA